MKIYYLIVFLIVLATFALADKCLQCMCLVESRCSPIGCNMDEGSLSCGYFQIKWPYYIDCGQPGGPGEENWKSCANDYSCSVRCIQNYIARYGNFCPQANSCERIARLHNGGPYGCSSTQKVDWYWSKVKTCLYR
uniref:lysozyme n=1 Tax=Acrobeloides nanus TaxID=290746 RepID=A0A914CW35_9BILA